MKSARAPTHIQPESGLATDLATTGASVNVSNAAAPDAIGQVLTVTSLSPLEAGFATDYNLPAGWVSIDEYGTGLGTTASVADTDTAYANAIASGANVYLPTGTNSAPRQYLMANTHNAQPAVGQIVQMYSKNVTLNTLPSGARDCIIFHGQTNWMFDQSTALSHVEGIHVLQHTDYVPTAGGHFRQGNASTLIRQPSITRCIAQGGYVGFKAYGMQLQSRLLQNAFIASVYADMEIDLAIPYGDLQWTENRLSGSTHGRVASTQYGLLVHAIDTSRGVGLSIKGTYVNEGIYLKGDTGVVNNLNIDDCDAEFISGATYAIRLGGSSYGVMRCELSNLNVYAGNGSITAPYTIYLAANAEGNEIDVSANLYLVVDYGDFNVIHMRASRPNAPSDVVTGTGLTLGGQDGIVSGIIGKYTNGLSFIAGAANYSLGLLNLRNNTNVLAAASDATAKAASKGRGVIGPADWG